MLNTSRLFFESIKKKKIAFIGMGVSNFDCICMFLKMKLDVTVLDRSDFEALGLRAEQLRESGAKFLCGEKYLDSLTEYDIVVRSPGVYFHHPKLQQAIRLGTVVTSEMELFFELCPCKIVGVSGSDGKTTTTTLISEMLKQQGYRVHLGGNIGKALLPMINGIQPEDIAVVELSSFQLLSMRCSPDIAVITNISPNHLDVHGTMDEYILAKQNLILHQSAFGRVVLNLDNSLSNEQEKLARGMVEKFSRVQKVNHGVYYNETDQGIYLVEHGNTQLIMHREEIRIPGIHNVENYLASIAAVHPFVSFSNIQKVARSFGGVEHRIEFVRELNGVKWYNDSIATTPTRTIAGLNAFDQKIILIAGGYDKKISYLPLAPALLGKVKILILMGATAEKIEQSLQQLEGYQGNNPKIIHADSMEQAVEQAYQSAENGDVVSLSPASASFDSYKNFEARGEHYKQLVAKLK